MARYPSFATEFQFVERMVAEESVFCLPGKVSLHVITIIGKLISSVVKVPQ